MDTQEQLLEKEQTQMEADFLEEEVKMAEEEAKEFECITYGFDFDEEQKEVLVLEKQIPKNILGIVPTALKTHYFIYAQDILSDGAEEDSKVFFYAAFLEEMQEAFESRGFDDQKPKKLENLFKFLKTSRKDLCQDFVFPELEIVFEKPTHKVFASILVGEKIVCEDEDFEKIDEIAKNILQPPIPKKVSPALPKKLELDDINNLTF